MRKTGSAEVKTNVDRPDILLDLRELSGMMRLINGSINNMRTGDSP